MKRYFYMILALSLLLCGCGAPAPEVTTPTTEETKPIDTFPYPEIEEKLTWEAINAQPTKRADMTIQEMREACVAFMRFSKTAMWTPNDNMHFVRNAKGAEDDMYKGVVYAGLPYVGLGTGNVYRMMDYLNEATGVMDMEMPMQNPKLFGKLYLCDFLSEVILLFVADEGQVFRIVGKKRCFFSIVTECILYIFEYDFKGFIFICYNM